MACQSFERTWWRLFEKCVVRTKFDIYVFIAQHKPLLWKAAHLTHNHIYYYSIVVRNTKIKLIKFKINNFLRICTYCHPVCVGFLQTFLILIHYHNSSQHHYCPDRVNWHNLSHDYGPYSDCHYQLFLCSLSLFTLSIHTNFYNWISQQKQHLHDAYDQDL